MRHLSVLCIAAFVFVPPLAYADEELQSANVQVEDARTLLKRADAETGLAQKELRQAAAERYDNAVRAFQAGVVRLKKKLSETKDIARPELDQLRAEYLQYQLLHAFALEESVDAIPDDAAKRKERLTKAEAEFGEIHEKYRTRVAGLYAHMYQGRCAQKLGKYKEALAIYDELLALPKQPTAFAELREKVMALKAECEKLQTMKKIK